MGSIRKEVLKKFSGMQSKLILSFSCLLFLSILIALIAYGGSRRILAVYHNYVNQYEALSDFYRNIESAESYANAYLYDRLEAQMSGYQQSVQKAMDNLNVLKKNTQKQELRTEYKKLENMVDNYNSLFFQIINGTSLLTDDLGFFRRIPANIQSTYIAYTEMITSNMNEEYKNINKNLQRQLTVTGFIIVLMILGALLGSGVAVRSITQPIGRLVENVKRIKQGNYQIERVKSPDAKLQLLSDAIVEMAEGIQENIAYMEERATLEKILIETELKVLQGQINPHFLFNTLNLISKMAYLEQAHKTSVLMEKTSDLLRYSLEKSKSTSDLSGEIESISNYMEIQKVRFGHRIQFMLHVEENLPNVIIPGMILQPLIENAVVHGTQDMVDRAQISMEVFMINKTIHIIIEDNGKGMSSDTVEKILSENKSGIGIQNVQKRLKMFYGEEGRIQIESSENCGTAITILIPITGEEQHV